MNRYASVFVLSFFMTQGMWAENQNSFSNTAESRIQYLEDQLQTLTGKIEELEHMLKTQKANEISTPTALASNPPASIVAAPQETTPLPGTMPTQPAKPSSFPTVDKLDAAAHPSEAQGLPEGDAQADYDRAISLLNQGAFSEAEISLTNFIKTHAGHPLIMNAKYWLGETYYSRKDYARASVAFADVYKLYKQNAKKEGAGKNPAKAPEALVKLAFSLKGLGKDDAARATLAQLHKEFPHLPKNVERLAKQAQKTLGVANAAEPVAKKRKSEDAPAQSAAKKPKTTTVTQG